MTTDVIALPGGIMPAALRYGALASALGDEVKLHFKDLEVYAQELRRAVTLANPVGKR